MSGHSHDDHHAAEQKPVAFTVPLILAAVTILIIVLFLSLCDPKAHHTDHHSGDNHAVEGTSHSSAEGSQHATPVDESH